MQASAMTIRLEQRLKGQLAKIGELRHTTMNKLINQAIEQYVANETLVLQEELEASLEELKRYRTSDPDFEKAIEQVATAELSTEHDPAQGVAENAEGHEATKLVRGLLGA